MSVPDDFQRLLEQTSLYADAEISDAYDAEAAERYARGPGAPLTEEAAAKAWAAYRRGPEPMCADAEVFDGKIAAMLDALDPDGRVAGPYGTSRTGPVWRRMVDFLADPSAGHRRRRPPRGGMS